MRFELDFSYGQEKDIPQKEDRQPEKTNPEKISSQKKSSGKEEASEEGGCPETRRKAESDGEKETGNEKEICREENPAGTRSSRQPCNSKGTSRSGSRVRRTVRRYARAIPQKL